jgi:hypothetical protein
MSKEQLLEQAGIQIRGLAEGAGIRPIAMAIDLAEVGRKCCPRSSATSWSPGTPP